MMSKHPLNLVLRFFLELAGLAAMAYWGWATHDLLLARWFWGIGLPLAAAVLWGVFRVPGDPGDAPVPVPGAVRLLLEALFFGGAVVFLMAANQPRAAGILGGLVLIHYITSYDRIARLVARR